MGRALNPRQLQFCMEYVVDHNATQAAIRAGYSAHTAHIHASKLLTNANVREKIDELSRSLAEKVGITAEMVLQAYKDIGFSNVLDHIDITTGELKASADGRLIQSITITDTPNGVKRVIKFHSKAKALEVMAKVTGIVKVEEKEKNISPEEIKSFLAVMEKLKQ